MATIKEIAELAGVSRGTVDRVLNHRGFVNADTEKKVLEIAGLLNYQPNKAGMALAAQKKKYVIGLILSPYNAAEVALKIDELWEAGIPCVTVNTDIPNSKRIAYVGSDYHKCGRVAANLLQLVDSGIIRLGIVTGSHNILCHEERIRGFSDYVKANKLPVQIVDIRENNDDDYQSYDIVSAMLSEHPQINALYFTAAGVFGGCRAIQNSSLSKLPVVITFDAVPSTLEMLKTGIITATICQHPEEQGARSLSLLVDYLLTNKLPEQPLVHMDLEIKIKESF